jgi:hypothetical protein
MWPDVNVLTAYDRSVLLREEAKRMGESVRLNIYLEDLKEPTV